MLETAEPLLQDVSSALEEANERGGWNWSRTQFYELIRRGEIRSVRVGKRIRIPRDEVRRLCGELV